MGVGAEPPLAWLAALVLLAGAMLMWRRRAALAAARE